MARHELIVTFRMSSSFPSGVVAQRWKTSDRCVIGTLPKLVRSLYRLIALDGSPHPVLDAPYESIDAAEAAACVALFSAFETDASMALDCSLVTPELL